MDLDQMSTWVLAELPRYNRAILRDGAPVDVLTDAVRGVVLPGLPEPGRLAPLPAQRLLVLVGLLGASLARHDQERRPDGAATPQRSFDGLTVGTGSTPFRQYVATVADRTGTGHCHRDSYASLVRWNVGTVEVRLAGAVVAVLPGAFDDGRIRTYTGTAAEERFFVLVKKGEAIELAVNALLRPFVDGTPFDTPDGVDRVRRATVLLEALRRLFLDFAALPVELSMPPEHFLDVFRQFAVHWTPGDIPPSGALDAEALRRDFLLGIALPGYDGHVRRLFPALLTEERSDLADLMARPPLPQRLASVLGVDLSGLAVVDAATRRRAVARHPVLVDWYRLLTAHARAAGAHLMLSQKFLFKPQRQRDAEGLGDRPLVSNRRGTTGMTETFLERLTRARREHVLAPLRGAVQGETVEIGLPAGVRSEPGTVPDVSVRVTG